MSTWTKQKLDEIAEEKRIAYLPSSKEHLLYIGLEHIEQQSLTLSSIGDSAETGSQKKKFQSGDVLYGSLRPYFRKIYKPKFDGVCSTDITVLSTKNENSSSYLFYLVAGKEFIDRASGAANGTKMPRAGWGIVKQFEFAIPDIKAQLSIASILSAYDDLIENNEKRIKILEEMAERLYREWFVKFKFPSHKKVRLIDSGTEYGKIPEGWEVKNLGDICIIGRGSSPRPISDRRYFKNGKIPWLKIADATKSGLFILETKEYVNEYGASFSRLIKKNSLVIATSGTLGFTKFIGRDCCIHDGWMYISSNEKVSNEYLFYIINGYKEYFDMVSYGAAIKNINTEILRNIPILIPRENTLNLFQDRILNVNGKILNLLIRNKNLSKIRDLLIPQLVTGKREIRN